MDSIKISSRTLISGSINVRVPQVHRLEISETEGIKKSDINVHSSYHHLLYLFDLCYKFFFKKMGMGRTESGRIEEIIVISLS